MDNNNVLLSDRSRSSDKLFPKSPGRHRQSEKGGRRPSESFRSSYKDNQMDTNDFFGSLAEGPRSSCNDDES